MFSLCANVEYFFTSLPWCSSGWGGGRELLDEGPRCLVPPLVMIIFRRSEALGSAVKCGLLKTLENR
jgi:hypothetical protein